jgi:hypothetical protein
LILNIFGGEGGIRTPDSLATMSDFESGAFNRALPPLRVLTSFFFYLKAGPPGLSRCCICPAFAGPSGLPDNIKSTGKDAAVAMFGHRRLQPFESDRRKPHFQESSLPFCRPGCDAGGLELLALKCRARPRAITGESQEQRGSWTVAALNRK